MMKKIIYLDWCSIGVLKDSLSEGSSKGIGELFRNLQEQGYSFPISNAHFMDLMRSKEEDILEDLNFLQREFKKPVTYISGLYCNRLEKSHAVGFIYEEFQKVVEQQKTNEEEGKKAWENMIFNMKGGPYTIDIDKVPEDNILKKYIDTEGQLTLESYQNMLRDLEDKQNDPVFMNEFMNTLRNMEDFEDPIFESFESEELKTIVRNYNNSSHQFKEITKTKLTKKEQEKFRHFFQKHLEIINLTQGADLDFNTMSNEDKTHYLFGLLGFLTPRGAGEVFRERNRPINSFTDSVHLIRAQCCDVLVSEDRGFRLRSDLFFQLGMSSVRAISLDELDQFLKE